jgi:hypothetical protein
MGLQLDKYVGNKNKTYVEEKRACFYISCTKIVILKNVQQPTLVYYSGRRINIISDRKTMHRDDYSVILRDGVSTCEVKIALNE